MPSPLTLTSPLTFATATEVGLEPTAKVCRDAKLDTLAPDTVVFSSTLAALSTRVGGSVEKSKVAWLATTRSGLPSPSTSAAASEVGLGPMSKVCWVWKVATRDGFGDGFGVVFSRTLA